MWLIMVPFFYLLDFNLVPVGLVHLLIIVATVLLVGRAVLFEAGT